MHWPGQPLRLPDFLLTTPDLLISYDTDQWSPDYSHPKMLEAIDFFLADFAARYDGDPRIAFLQQGLLGYWGEWHSTYIYKLYIYIHFSRIIAAYPYDFIGEATKDTVMNWFKVRMAPFRQDSFD